MIENEKMIDMNARLIEVERQRNQVLAEWTLTKGRLAVVAVEALQLRESNESLVKKLDELQTEIKGSSSDAATD